MLAETISLGDVRDVAAFVQATLNRSRRVYPADERDDLFAEGVCIMLQLHARFDPHRDGYEHAGRFSGFAAKYLPLKLEDAYHRLHPEHTLRTCPDGRRRYDYGERAVSLEALTGDDPERDGVMADIRQSEQDLRATVGRALDERWRRRRRVILDVADVLGQGGTPADAASILGLASTQVKDAVDEILAVSDRLQTGTT